MMIVISLKFIGNTLFAAQKNDLREYIMSKCCRTIGACENQRVSIVLYRFNFFKLFNEHYKFFLLNESL